MRKKIASLILPFIVLNLFSFAILTTPAHADIADEINTQLEPVKDIYDEGDNIDQNSFVEKIAETIKIVLSFLGLIFLILIIYAGFLWLTSAGSEEKIGKAKSIMISAIIGVAIILAAYMITTFVVGQIASVTVANN